MTGVLVAGLCAYAQGQQAPESKEAQANEVKGMAPRLTPGDYPSQTRVGTLTMAAEFTGHSVPRPEGPLTTDEYVVVEIGFFGPAGARITLSRDNFSLRINGKKAALASQPFELVTRSIKDPQWAPPAPPEKSKTSFGTGGDTGSTPPVVHVPIELQRAMAQHLQRSSMPEGDRALPEAGLIFFQYGGKAKSIRSIELIYSGPAGKAMLPLQP
jgi:hypothetical protein